MSRFKIFLFVIAAIFVGSVRIGAQTIVPGSQFPLASPQPSDILFGIHGGTNGVSGQTSKFTIGSITNLFGTSLFPASLGACTTTAQCTFPTPLNSPAGYTFPGMLIASTIANGATAAQTLPQFFAQTYYLSDWTGAECNGTDVTANLQTAIYASAGVARLVIDPGPGYCMYGNGTDVIVPSNSYIVVDGYMQQNPGVASNFLHIAGGATNVVITGNGTIDGNGSSETSTAAKNQGVITQSMTSNVWVSGLHIVNMRNSAVNLATCQHCFMSNLVVNNTNSGLGHAVEFSAASNDCWADNIHINNIGIDGGWAFYGGVYNCGISNSISTNNYVTGFGVDDDSALPAESHDIIFANDIASMNSLYGFEVGAAGGAAEQDISYANVQCSQNNYGCLNLEAGSGYNIVGLKAHNDIGPAAYGINIQSNEQQVSNVNITGCDIRDEGTGGVAGVGIQANNVSPANPPPGVNITGCHIYDDGAGVMKYGITGGLGAGSGMQDNLITGMATANIPVAVPTDAAEFQYNGTGSYVTPQNILAANGFYAGTSATTANIYGSNNMTLQQGNQACFAYTGTPTWCEYQDGSGNFRLGPLTTGSGNFYIDANGLSNSFTFENTATGGLIISGTTITLDGTNGPVYKYGSGAPTGTCVPGSHYVRNDSGAAAGSQEYSCRNVSGTGTWEALSGG